MIILTFIFYKILITGISGWTWTTLSIQNIFNYLTIIIALTTAFITLRIKYVELKLKKEDLVKKRKKPKIKKNKIDKHKIIKPKKK